MILQVTARAVLEIIDGKQPPGAEATPDHSAACANCGASGATSGVAPAPAAVNPSAPTILPTAAETGRFSFVAAGTHSAAPACSNVGPVPPESGPDNIFGAL